MMRRLALLSAAVCLAALPASAAKLASAPVGVAGVARITCGVTYLGTAEATVGVKIFNLGTPVLDKEIKLSATVPASWWRTSGCPATGCSAPWCQVTTPTDKPKTQFRATMCVESRTGTGEEAVFTPLVCVPVQ